MEEETREERGEKIFVFFIFFEKNKSTLKHRKMCCLGIM